MPNPSDLPTGADYAQAAADNVRRENKQLKERIDDLERRLEWLESLHPRSQDKLTAHKIRERQQGISQPDYDVGASKRKGKRNE